MPDLGAYAAEVTLAYAGSLCLLAVIVAMSFAQSARARRRLEDAEARQKDE